MALDLNRRTLSRQMAEQVDGLTVQLAAAAIDVFLDTVTTTIAAGGTVRLAGFGSFTRRYRKSRQTLHPRTHQPVQIPAVYLPNFTPSPLLRQRMPTAIAPTLDVPALDPESNR